MNKSKHLCPYHDEKTPSMVVDWEKGVFRCFGCGVVGKVGSIVEILTQDKGVKNEKTPEMS